VFCHHNRGLGRDRQRPPPRLEFRNATEAQWNTRRAGTTTATSFGDSLSRKQANFRGIVQRRRARAVVRRAQSRKLPANAWEDTRYARQHFEWCGDWSHAKLRCGSDPGLDSASLHSRLESNRARSRRPPVGGCWADDGVALSVSCRLRLSPSGVTTIRLSGLPSSAIAAGKELPTAETNQTLTLTATADRFRRSTWRPATAAASFVVQASRRILPPPLAARYRSRLRPGAIDSDVAPACLLGHHGPPQ